MQKSIVVFDFETTGTDTENDQIIQYAFQKILPDGSKDSISALVKPSIPISPGAAEVTGIDDEVVKDALPLRDHLNKISSFIGMPNETILAGHNIRRFDVPIFAAELARNDRNNSIIFEYEMIDTMILYMNHRPRTLKAMYEDLTGKKMSEDAHDAGVDVSATWECILEFIDLKAIADESGSIRFEEIEQQLIEESTPEGFVDFAGKLKDEDGVIVYAIGKDKGKSVIDHPGFGNWMLGKDFPMQTKEILIQILNKK